MMKEEVMKSGKFLAKKILNETLFLKVLILVTVVVMVGGVAGVSVLKIIAQGSISGDKNTAEIRVEGTPPTAAGVGSYVYLSVQGPDGTQTVKQGQEAVYTIEIKNKTGEAPKSLTAQIHKDFDSVQMISPAGVTITSNTVSGNYRNLVFSGVAAETTEIKFKAVNNKASP